MENTQSPVRIIDEQPDETYEHSNPESIHCTDVFCLLVFLAFSLLILILSMISWEGGSLQRLTSPYDSDGNCCGVDQNVAAYSYFYFASPQTDSLWVTTCVKKCPTSQDSALDCFINSIVKSCNQTIDADNTKAVMVYPTTLSGTICMPDSTSIRDKIAEGLRSFTVLDIYTALQSNQSFLIYAILIALAITLASAAIIKLTSQYFIHIVILASFACALAFGLYLVIPSVDPALGIKNNEAIRLSVGALLLIASVVILSVYVYSRTKIVYASSILVVGSRFISSKSKLLLIPIGASLLLMPYMWWEIFMGICLYSMVGITTQSQQLPMQHQQITWDVTWKLILHLVGFVWGLNIFVDVSSFFAAGVSYRWYLKQQMIYRETFRNTFYHVGSICMGSFLTTLFSPLKTIYTFLIPQEHQGCCSACKLCCSCAWCFCSTFIFKQMSTGAYSIVHSASTDYCHASETIQEIKKNESLSASLLYLLSITFCATSFLITIITIMIMESMLQNRTTFQRWVVMCGSGAFAWIVADIFMSSCSEIVHAIAVGFLRKTIEQKAEGTCPSELDPFMKALLKSRKLIESRKNSIVLDYKPK